MAEEKEEEFCRWTESNWKNSDIDWRLSKFVTVGIDVGSISSQACIMADGQIFVYDRNLNETDRINLPERPISITFGGADRDILFITTVNSLYGMRVRTRNR